MTYPVEPLAASTPPGLPRAIAASFAMRAIPSMAGAVAGAKVDRELPMAEEYGRFVMGFAG
jgi:hypothetical protein